MTDREQIAPDMVEAAAKAHCDFFGGKGWWDSGLIADTKPRAIEAMKAAIAAMQPHLAQAKDNQTVLSKMLESIVAMQALRYGDATGTHLALSVLCESARALLTSLGEQK